MTLSKISSVLMAFLLPVMAYSHGDDNHDKPIPADDRTIYEEFFEDVIVPIVQNNCLACHNSSAAAGGHSFETPHEIKSHADLIFDAVSHSRMPLERPEWRETLDAKTLLFWADKEKTGGHDH